MQPHFLYCSGKDKIFFLLLLLLVNLRPSILKILADSWQSCNVSQSNRNNFADEIIRKKCFRYKAMLCSEVYIGLVLYNDVLKLVMRALHGILEGACNESYRFLFPPFLLLLLRTFTGSLDRTPLSILIFPAHRVIDC